MDHLCHREKQHETKSRTLNMDQNNQECSVAQSLKFRNLHVKIEGVRCLHKHLLSYYCFCQEHIYKYIWNLYQLYLASVAFVVTEFSVEEQRFCFPHQHIF